MRVARFLGLSSVVSGCVAIVLVFAVLAGATGPADRAVASILVPGSQDSVTRTSFLAGDAFWSWVPFSAPGSGVVTVAVTVIATLALLLARRWLAGLLCAVATSGGYALMYAVKAGVARSRPTVDLRDALSPDSLGLAAWDPASGAFPSGHAMLSLVVYGYLASSLPPSLRPVGWALALAIALVVGASRVALEAHWPSDVLGGWLIGAAWLLALLAVRAALLRS